MKTKRINRWHCGILLACALGAASLSAACSHRSHEITDVRRDVRAVNLRGNALYYRGDYEGAAKLYDRARLLAMRVDDRAGVAESLNNLGQVYLFADDYAAAEEKFNEALRINEEIGNRRGEAANLLNLGSVALAKGDANGASELFDRALEIYREDVNRLGEGEAQNSKGLAALKAGDSEEAERLFDSALDIAKGLKRHRLEGACYSNMGKLMEGRGDLHAALQNYNMALASDRMVEYSMGIAGDLVDSGRVLMGLNRLPEARDVLERALAIYTQLGIRRDMQRSLRALADIASMQGETNAVKKYGDELEDISKAQKKQRQPKRH